VIERRIADAEKELDMIRTSIPATETTNGYLKACEGLILTAKTSNDRYLYLSKIEKTQEQLRALRKEFRQQTANPLNTDYDRGYFQILESFFRKLERSNAQPKAT
jgi:gamma-glutamyl-gamma-aminobutyrate hydrolase PuuD